MGSAEVLVAPTEKVQFMEDMKNEVQLAQLGARYFVQHFMWLVFVMIAQSAQSQSLG